MQNALECQAVNNLLYLCDQDPPLFLKNNYVSYHHAECRVLTEQSRTVKSNTSTHYSHSYHSTIKLKTESQAFVDHTPTPDTTQNKENLKRILEKLRNSPSPQPKEQKKERKPETFHTKTLNSEPQSLSKYYQKTTGPFHRSLKKVIPKIKEKDLIKSLVKAKIVERLKTGHIKKGETENHGRFREESQKISTLRDTQALKRGQMALQFDKKRNKKDNISYYNLLKDEKTVNMGMLLNGKGSQIILKHLLF